MTLVAATDFSAIGSRRAVDVALHRLLKQGELQRLTRGLYYVPRTHPLLGELKPTQEEILKTLASKEHIRTQPTGAYAANLLGLSDQVPMRVVYLTDGPTRRIRIGQQEILLKRTTLKNMLTAGRASGLVIQALRYLGQSHVDEATVRRLQATLGAGERRVLLKDVPLAPDWIGKVMHRVAEGAGK